MKRPELAAAIAFLTCIPITPREPFDAERIGRSAVWFPLVGALIGGWTALALYVGTWIWPHVPTLVVIVATVAMVRLTGGLHQDALADMADGFGGGRTRADVLRIMRDSVIGSFGGLALVLSMGLRCVALTALVVAGHATGWLVAACTVARWVAVMLGWLMPYARVEPAGLGRAMTDFVTWREGVGATSIALVLGVLALGPGQALTAMGLASLVATVVGVLGWRRIRGMTGDTLGAATEVTEVAILLLGAAFERG